MIVYQASKTQFLDDMFSNNIENIILACFKNKLHRSTSPNEIRSWKESMKYMESVLHDQEIPGDSGVLIEYQLPQSSKRIDFIICGQNESTQPAAVLIELKQWGNGTVKATDKDGVLETTFFGEVSHPSYQAWSYQSLIENYNSAVTEKNIILSPCAYLHNYSEDGILSDSFYKEYLEKAPLFLKDDAQKLRDFIKKFVKHGDNSKVMYEIEHGEIKPSKALADSVVGMLKGKQEFVMIDEQKVVYETGLALSKKSSSEKKQVFIVEGGPGTGKSVVAINLLVELTKQRKNVQYVSKNAAPRAVYESKLAGTLKRTEIANLFSGSGTFFDVPENSLDVLVIDEAHRLNLKSGIFKNKGENQVKELIEACKCAIFFIDEDQKVTFHDVGTKEEIIKWANLLGAEVVQSELTSQFRCGGSDGYLSWLDNVLQIKETANINLEGVNYDFQIFDNPNELRKAIEEKNAVNNSARLVAGYCWDWVSKKDKNLYDVTIPEFDFKMKWNLADHGSLWIINKDSVSEVGCIHTCQGLEMDYVGVIVGGDLKIENEKLLTKPEARAKTDKSLSGYKKLLKVDPEGAKKKADAIIRNTYRALMTRGMKGCYVYFVDKEVEKYFKSRIAK